MHCKVPDPVAYEPFWHDVHAFAKRAPLNVPGSHNLQPAESEIAEPVMYCPRGQDWHTLLPIAEENDPEAQAT